MRFDVDKHIVFQLINRPGKTFAWRVCNTMANQAIGIVKWYPSWRHYCFFPHDGAVFSDRCMVRIGEFVERQNKKRTR